MHVTWKTPGASCYLFLFDRRLVGWFTYSAWGKVSATLRHALDMDAHARNMQ